MNLGHVALEDIHDLIKLNKDNSQFNIVPKNNPVLRQALKFTLARYFDYIFKDVFNYSQMKAFEKETTDKINNILDMLDNTDVQNGIDFSYLHCETNRMYFDNGETFFLDANYVFIDMSIFYTLISILLLLIKYSDVKEIELIVKFIK